MKKRNCRRLTIDDGAHFKCLQFAFFPKVLIIICGEIIAKSRFIFQHD